MSRTAIQDDLSLDLKLKTETLPAPSFQWRDRKGIFHPISGMETRHLFFTVRMIWNHRMPAVARSANYIQYTFQPVYTSVYLAQAIRMMIPELMKRGDIQPDWQAEIDRWLVYLGHVDKNPQELS